MKQKLLLKVMLLLCALVAGSSSVWADSESYTATSSDKPTATNGTTNGNVTGTNSISWSYSVTQATKKDKSPFVQYSDDYGWQLGSGNSPCTAFSISTSGISGTITKIQVVTGSKDASSTINVTVGGNNFGTQGQATGSGATVATQTFTGSASGEIIVSATASSAAFYFKSVTVTYTPSGGSSVAQPSFSPAAGAVDAGTTITLTQAAADEIRYTIDGTDPTKTTGNVYSTPIAITTPTTIKAIAVKDDEVSSVATAAYTISVAAPTFSLDGGSYMQGTKITITSEDNTIYYTTTTDGTEPTAPTTSSTEYTAPIAIPSGSFRIKAIAVDNYGNKSNPTQRTYTGIAPASLPFSWTGTSSAGKAQLAEVIGVSVNLGSDYAASNAPYRLKYDAVGKYVIIYTDEKPENVYFTAKLLGGKADTGTKMKVQGSADGVTFDDIEEFTIKGAANATFEFTTSNAFAATHRAVKLVLSSLDKNVGVGTICVSCLPIKPAKEYTTLTCPYALDFTSVSSDLKAYIATSVSAGSVQMTQVNKVPANTGLVLVKTSGTTFNVPVFDGTGADDVTGNQMAGSATETTTIAENAGYILKDGAFHPATAGTLAAGKAYLNIAVPTNNAPALKLDFGGATGINTVQSSEFMVNGEFYNLAGQRVAQPTKGLYIVNGKKVIIK